ncbi:Phosphatidylserine decarboxylase proenzyme mitochondrial [Paragonimus heterotremus]|uniref:phosphatidylserine decarboxylase n=1 Tax=Paragonimus heterotremus TaxID=100268 RepID=A0A8J4TIU1_9TREM|nr:Phosphatidylserine decarboxylase proenzyme mitochondrial [Paragonimus heterotremus]
MRLISSFEMFLEPDGQQSTEITDIGLYPSTPATSPDYSVANENVCVRRNPVQEELSLCRRSSKDPSSNMRSSTSFQIRVQQNESSKWIRVSALAYYILYWLGTAYIWRLVYERLPLRTTSRVVGRLARIRLPYWMRAPIYRGYGWLFQVKLDEVEHFDDLARYDSISAFFQRRLRPSVHNIDPHSNLISPADGTVLCCGLVKDGHLEQVKGLFYSLHGLLGPNTWKQMETTSTTSAHSLNQPRPMHPIRSATELNAQFVPCMTSQGMNYLPIRQLHHITDIDQCKHPALVEYNRNAAVNSSTCAHSSGMRLEDLNYVDSLLLTGALPKTRITLNSESKPESKVKVTSKMVCGERLTGLYHILIYLSPGDYHRFHSPTDWTIFMRRHFPGKLFPVSPSLLKHHDQLYCTNERVVYVGRWQCGFFAFVAVGSTNVGSIEIFADPNLVTNVPRRTAAECSGHRNSSRHTSQKQSQPHLVVNTENYQDLYFQQGVSQVKGNTFGKFNFGSTVILLFEAPLTEFQFTVTVGSRIRVGQSIGSVSL